jgi:hypothetical protein
MKRTQLYLDDDMAKILSTVSRQQGTTVSELVRACVREKFAERQNVDKVALAREIAGIWRNRRDVADVKQYVRRLRKNTRRRRLTRDQGPA